MSQELFAKENRVGLNAVGQCMGRIVSVWVVGDHDIQGSVRAVDPQKLGFRDQSVAQVQNTIGL